MPEVQETVLKASQSRVFLIEDGAAPYTTPEYMGRMIAGANTFGQGTLTPVFAPSSQQYGRFVTIDKLRGAPDLPGLTLTQRMRLGISDLLRIVNKGCDVDVHVHFGSCEDPTDFDLGWEFVRILESASPSAYNTDALGTFDPNSDAVVTENVPLEGEALYDVKRLLATELAGATITDEIVDVIICDSKTCGECGISSDGCQVIFALGMDNSGSPGTPAKIYYSDDGGTTWAATPIATLGLAEAPDAFACVGTNLVVVSNASASLHYAPIADILAGTESWTEVTTGFDVSGPPNAIVSLGRTATFIAGDGGFTYFSADITAGVTAQADGTLTAQNLTAIKALSSTVVVAVGASNTVLFTVNGGDVWSLVTGPSVGVALTALQVRSASEWLVGNASGALNYTRDSGENWTTKAFPGSGSGTVRDIDFATRNVGYLAHNDRILRTINGGSSWIVLPEAEGLTIPANQSIDAIAACAENPNLVFGGGIASGGTDGFLVKFA